MNNKTQFNIWYWFAAFAGLMLFQYLFTIASQVVEIPYSEFESHLQAGRIAEVQVSDRYVQGSFRQALEGGQTRFITTRVEPDFAEQLRRNDVVVTGQIESTFLDRGDRGPRGDRFGGDRGSRDDRGPRRPREAQAEGAGA